MLGDRLWDGNRLWLIDFLNIFLIVSHQLVVSITGIPSTAGASGRNEANGKAQHADLQLTWQKVVSLAALDRATKQPIRNSVEGSGESIHQLDC